jgi:hypothetical protein
MKVLLGWNETPITVAIKLKVLFYQGLNITVLIPDTARLSKCCCYMAVAGLFINML